LLNCSSSSDCPKLGSQLYRTTTRPSPTTSACLSQKEPRGCSSDFSKWEWALPSVPMPALLPTRSRDSKGLHASSSSRHLRGVATKPATPSSLLANLCLLSLAVSPASKLQWGEVFSYLLQPRKYSAPLQPQPVLILRICSRMPRQAITEIAHYVDVKSNQAAQREKLRNDLQWEDRVSKFHVLGIEVAEEVGHDVVGTRTGSSVHGDELHIEDERRSGRDAQRDALVAVGELDRDL
jgi:hypothetical protein